jgi:hypothetical protein
MQNWLSKLREEDINSWGKVMLAHPFEERDWQDARARLLELLKADGKQAEEGPLRSYLSCCAESVGGSHPLPPLRSLVEELYGAYGMENADDSIN